MRYVAIDLETTGLDPMICEPLQVALVAEDTTRDEPVERLPAFECLVRPELSCVYGEPYALALNHEILRAIATAPSSGPAVYRGRELPVISAAVWEAEADAWLTSVFGPGRVTCAGKNAAGFDLRFLKPNGPLAARFHHRVLDPGSVFVDWTEPRLASLDQLKTRLGVAGLVLHDALEDARDVVRVLRRAYR